MKNKEEARLFRFLRLEEIEFEDLFNDRKKRGGKRAN